MIGFRIIRIAGPVTPVRPMNPASVVYRDGPPPAVLTIKTLAERLQRPAPASSPPKGRRR